jgi:hypothetical protein
LARYLGNGVEKRAAITLTLCFSGGVIVRKSRMLRRVT